MSLFKFAIRVLVKFRFIRCCIYCIHLSLAVNSHSDECFSNFVVLPKKKKTKCCTEHKHLIIHKCGNCWNVGRGGDGGGGGVCVGGDDDDRNDAAEIYLFFRNYIQILLNIKFFLIKFYIPNLNIIIILAKQNDCLFIWHDVTSVKRSILVCTLTSKNFFLVLDQGEF